MRRRATCGRRPPASSGARRSSPSLQAALKAHRLVTLTGVGGVGKTRLALEVAARLGHEFPDGVWVVELAPVGDPAAVPEAVAAVLGITQQPGMSAGRQHRRRAGGPVTAVGVRQLRARARCRGRPDRGDPRPHSTTVKILATSREGLGWPTNNSGRCRRWTSRRSRLERSGAVRRARRAVAPAFSLTAPMTRAPSSRSAAASTASRWRSSWRRRACCR